LAQVFLGVFEPDFTQLWDQEFGVVLVAQWQQF